ncbi:TPA: hypothetical protein ON189_004963 [Serratia marcescens]|nr:hypothetical protein [Serratia marcescens]
MYLNVAGVTGASTDAGYPQWIDVQAFIVLEDVLVSKIVLLKKPGTTRYM